MENQFWLNKKIKTFRLTFLFGVCAMIVRLPAWNMQRVIKDLSLKWKRELSLIAVEDLGEPNKKTEIQNDKHFDFNVTYEHLSKFMEGETSAST